ncbi:MAG: putative cysteine desulfurase [Chloroflexi bacterium]|nr:putative cysteine desulfurase [Chloroflexota bacterium]
MTDKRERPALDSEEIKKDFLILGREVHPGRSLVYLDSAATSQKPEAVIKAMDDYYWRHNANIHRGIHTLAEEATALYEGARAKLAAFINAPQPEQIIFTRNTTEAINLVAQSWARVTLKAGDRILLTEMEHHSNLVPWQILAAEHNLELDFIPVTPDGLLDLDAYRVLLKHAPKLVAFTHMSNVLGTINPARTIIQLAREAGAITLVDGAQAVPHMPVDLTALGADFYAFSAHKMCGPTGIGVLYGRRDLLEAMPPYMGGGDMIKSVSLRSFRPNELPHKFEAGTPSIAEGVGLGAAVDYLSALGMEAVAEHEHQLITYAMERLSQIPGLRVVGPDLAHKGGVASFTMEEAHPHDVAQILDFEGVAVRAGHHCAQPLHDKFNIPSTTRASFYLYNTPEDVDRLVDGIYRVKETFG